MGSVPGPTGRCGLIFGGMGVSFACLSPSGPTADETPASPSHLAAVQIHDL